VIRITGVVLAKLITGKFMLPKARDGARLWAHMDTPQSLDVSPAPTPAQLFRAAGQIDAVSLCAMLAIFIGWFFIDTLVVSLGSLQHGVRFYDLSAAITDPTRIFFNIDRSFQRLLFGLICLLCLLAPVFPHWRRNRLAWAAYLAPLALMVVSGALLYAKTSGDFIAASGDAGSLGGSVIRFANDLAHRGSGLLAEHISVGFGGYLAFAGSLVLAVQGLQKLRHSAEVSGGRAS
jgi:hypothetical protein